MDPMNRIAQALDVALRMSDEQGCPPRLAAAMRHAVIPGGARIRPQLCLAVAQAHGDDDPPLADAAAVAIELLHCASLVHDDLPCFDAAAIRRGVPSVHRAFGERLAVLAGDALIVLAFQAVGQAGARHPQRMARVISTVANGVGAPRGIVAGQAWECEPRVTLRDYQRAKTGALFAAATMAGADAAGAASQPWRALGELLGEAYQVADDIRDAVGDPAHLGKPAGQDLALGRPSVAIEQGLVGAERYFRQLVERAVESIPVCPRAARFRALIRDEAQRLVPATLIADGARVAA